MPTTYTITRPNDASYDFTIGLDAAFATTTTIRWEIHPTEGKFPLALTAPVTGTVDFSTTDTSKSASPPITRNHKFPRDFEIRLYNDDTNALLHTSDAQSVAGDATLAGVESLDGGGGDDKNIIGLGASEALVANGLRKDDAYIITRYQYGNVEISDTFGDANLIKFDYGVTITAVSESASIVFGNISYGSITLTLSTGAEVEITSPAGRFSYQLGDGAVLNYLDFKTAIKVAHDSSDSSIPPVASLPNEYAITTLTSVPELSANRVEADVSLDDAGGGDREDIISAATDYILDLNGLRSNDIYVITRFQHGNVEISDTFGDANLVKFDSAVTITAVSESASVVFGNISYGSITLTLSTGAEVEITSPAGRFSYQIGDGEVMNYIDFKAAIKVAHDSTNPAIPPVASLPQEFTVSSSRFDITGDALDGDVDENVGDADALFTFKAVLKSDANADVGYSITGGNTGDVFEVVKLNDGSGNAVISLASNKKLDYEDDSIANSYELTVQLSATATGATEAETHDVKVMISVNNVNEGEATYVVIGNVDAGVELEARHIAEDSDGEDSSVTPRYRWFRKDSSDPNPTSFSTTQTTTFRWLTSESTTNTYRIGTPIEDADYGVLVSYQDNRVGSDLSFTSALASTLKFGSPSYTTTINDGGGSFTPLDIAATLKGESKDITYAFVTGADSTNTVHKGFTIGASSGRITFTGSARDADFETAETITLTVRATHDNGDSNIPNPFGNVEVMISVNDLNDEKPVLDSAEDSISINEMEASGDFATGYTFTLTDADAVDTHASFTAGDFSFSINGNNDTRFGVVSLGGGTWELVLKDRETLDYETVADRNFVLNITATDANDNTSDALPVAITTINQNDNPPAFGDPLVSAWLTGFANGVIPEDTAIGTAIAVIDVSDADGAVLTVEVFSDATESAADKFEVVYNPTATRYELKIKERLDLDDAEPDPESNTLRLRVIDGTTSFDSDVNKPIALTIEQVNEPPLLTQVTPAAGHWRISFDQNKVPVLEQVTPTQPVDPDKTKFTLDEFEVLADAGDRGLGYEFTISDIDIDHGRPDTPLAHLRALNASNNTLQQIFTFIDKGNNRWELALKAGEELDYERYGDTLKLEIVTSDTFANVSNKLELTININNVNDEAPEFDNDPPITWLDGFEDGFIPEDTAKGTAIARVEVTDADGPDQTNDFPFFFRGPSVLEFLALFQILPDPGTGYGILRTTKPLDRETGRNTFEDLILVFDDGQGGFDDPGEIQTDPFTVTIADVNEHAPTLVLSDTAVTIDEGTAPADGTPIITVTVSDGDAKTYVQDDFALTGDARFDIVWDEASQRGQVVLKAGQTLDYETTADRTDIALTITVTDSDMPGSPPTPSSDSKTFNGLTLRDANDIGVVVITRNTTTKTLTATLSDDDGVGAAADGGGAIDPTYEWYNVATGAIVRAASTTNTFTYTDDNAHYRVRVEYTDGFAGVGNVEVEGSTAAISLAPISVQLGEHTTASVPLTAKRTSDGSTIASDALTLAFVLEDGSIANTYKGITISDTGIMPESAEKLNYEALTDDEKTNGIDFTIRATSGTDSVDAAFKVRIADTAELVSFGDDYTDYLKTVKLLDGEDYSTTDVIYTATATATSGGGISYTLGGTDADLFDINSANGNVVFRTATTVDGSMKDTYEFTVTATETGTTNTEHQSVTIGLPSIEIGPGQDAHSINNSDLGTSGSLLVAVIANVTVTGTSAMVDWAITGGEDAALFLLADRAGHGTNVKLNFGHANFVKKAEYKVKLTATNTVTDDTDDIEITLTVNNFVPPAPPITPDRQAEAHDPYDPDADPIAGIVPLPDNDPYAGS